MAANLKEAIENFKSQAGPFRSMFELADQLDAVGDVQQTVKEAGMQRQAALDEKAQAEKDRDAAKAAAAKLTDAAKAKAQQIIDSANGTASDALEQAKAEVADVMQAAKANAADAAKAEADATKRADEAEQRVADAKSELRALNEKITVARSTVQQILGK